MTSTQSTAPLVDRSATLDPLHGIVQAARDKTRISGLTHNHYRYPARFSPLFARSVIETFSAPGDWVVDPFAGGGTALVEAIALGRHALGIDINTLATFVCRAKTLVMNDIELAAFEDWRHHLPKAINMLRPVTQPRLPVSPDYQRNLRGNRLWRLRKAIEQALSTVDQVPLRGPATLARCVVLRAAQLALDGRRRLPTIPEFRTMSTELAAEMVSGTRLLRRRVETYPAASRPLSIHLNRSVTGAHADATVSAIAPPKLIITSPPYPGIHVLYHRWQVDGRKETPAPYWITGTADGDGSAHYTLGDRRGRGLATYFERLRDAFQSVSAMAGPQTTIVQVVAFSYPDTQLPQYLATMEQCGLVESCPWNIIGGDGRLWREVPNRRWHAQQNSHAPGAREVVLVHQKPAT